jgi:hypothetical protein
MCVARRRVHDGAYHGPYALVTAGQHIAFTRAFTFVHRVRNNRTVYAFAFIVVIRSSCFIYAKVENRLYKLQHRSSSLRDWFALGPHAVRVQRAQLLREQFV